MLTSIRKGVDSIFIRILLGLIAISFVGFGGISFMQGNSGGDVVTFKNTDSISLKQFLHAKHDHIRYIQRQNGITLTDEQIAELNIDNTILRDLIARAMISQLEEMYDFDISDEQVIKFVKQNPVFHNEEGDFNLERFKLIIRNSGRSEEDYLGFLKGQFTSETLSSIFQHGFPVPKMMVDNVANYMAETKTVNIYKMDLGFKDKTFKFEKPDEKFLHEIYNKNPKAFIIPEKRSFSYMKVSEQYLRKKVKINDNELKQYFEDNKEEFSSDDFKKAKKEVKELLTQAKLQELSSEFSTNLEDDVASGMNLKEIAAKYKLKTVSVDMKSKYDLSHSKKPEEIELAEPAFELSEGELSYPMEIQDQNIILLFELKAVTLARQREFAEVQGELTNLWKEKELMAYNAGKFNEYYQSNKGKGTKVALKKKGITLNSSKKLVRNELPLQDKLPVQLLTNIFLINKGEKTRIVQNGKDLYFAYVKDAKIDKKMAEKITKEAAEHFEKTIHLSIRESIIGYLAEQNKMQVNLPQKSGSEG